jgi:hypothetical protein
MTIALLMPTFSTSESFGVGNLFADQTNEAISWRNISNMTNPILIKHPLTDQWIAIDPSQAWFWTKEWQLGEQKVDEEFATGKYEDFESIDDFFAEI